MSESSDTSKRASATILCVDDDSTILLLLSIQLAPEGYQLLTASSAAEGLKLLEEHVVTLVVSDLRMPEMDGIEFLSQVRSRWPDTVRILLTGQSDIDATIAAINEGGVYRYIAKPFSRNDLLLSVRDAVNYQTLASEKARLTLLAQDQNQQLLAINAELEERVEARTAELRREHNRVLVANEKLKAGFAVSVKVFSQLIEFGEVHHAGHSRRVAQVARRIAVHMRIDRNQIQDIFISALLHDIGRFGLSPTIRSKAANELTPAEREQFKSHPARGAMVLMAVPELRLAGRVIRAHHERFDGMGYPDGLAGQDIPLGARILAVANDYDELQTGAMGEEYFEREQARDFIQEWSGRRYDPLVVEAFSALLSSGGLSLAGTDSLAIRELVLQPEQIEAGMVLSRDLISRDGLLLLAEEYVLDDEWIGMIREFSRSQDPSLVIHVDANKTIHNPHAILSERS